MVQIKQQYSSDLCQLPGMRALVRDVCRRNWGEQDHEEALAQLELAFQEAACNIIAHAYQGDPGQPIELVIEADDEQACVTLYHYGLDFDPGSVAAPSFDGSREGGFGIYLIHQSVDEVRYLHANPAHKETAGYTTPASGGRSSSHQGVPLQEDEKLNSGPLGVATDLERSPQEGGLTAGRIVDSVSPFARGRCGVRLLKKWTVSSPCTARSDEGDMHITSEQHGPVTVVMVHLEELEASNADDFRQEMAPLLMSTSSSGHKLILDLGRVRFIDSRGCGAILSILKHLVAQGGDLALCQVNDSVRTVFEMIRMHRICEIYPSREEALHAFS